MDAKVFEVQEEIDTNALASDLSVDTVRADFLLNKALRWRWAWILLHAYDPSDGDTWGSIGELRFYENESILGVYPFAFGTTTSLENVQDFVLTPTEGGTGQPVMRFGYKATLTPFAEHYVYVAPIFFNIAADRVTLVQKRFFPSGTMQVVWGMRLLSMLPGGLNEPPR
jgi:hypothetical protein